MPTIKELEDSLSAEKRQSARYQEEAKILRSLYEKLINKVKTDDPARFDQAAYHQTRGHLQSLVNQNREGLKPNDKILKDIVTQELKVRSAELDAIFDKAVNKIVEERIKTFKEEYLDNLEEKLTKEIDEKNQGRVAQAIETRLKERIAALESVFTQTVNDTVVLKLEPTKALLELNFSSRLQEKFDQELPTLLENRLQGRLVELRAEIESELQQQFQAKLEPAKEQLEANFSSRLQEKFDQELHTLLENRLQGRLIELRAEIESELQQQFQAKLEPAKEQLEANFRSSLQAKFDEELPTLLENRLQGRLVELRAEIESELQHQYLVELETAKAQLESNFRSSLQAKFDEELPTLLQDRVQARLAELRAEIESELQNQYQAKLDAQLSEVSTDCNNDESATSKLPMATPPNPGATIRSLEATIEDLSIELRAKTAEAETATANFEALERQITQKDNAVIAEREKTEGVRRALEKQKSTNAELEKYIQDLELRLQAAEVLVRQLRVEVRAAKTQASNASREKVEVQQMLAKFRQNNYDEGLVDSLWTEREELKVKVAELQTEITTLKVENAELPAASSNDYKKQVVLIQGIKGQLDKLRGEMPKFDLEPHAYDAPLDSESGEKLDIDLSFDIDTKSIRSEPVGDEGKSNDKKSAKGKSVDKKSAAGKVDDGGQLTPEPILGPVRIVERPMTIASHNPFRCWFETELATFLLGATLLFRLYYKIQKALTHDTAQAPLRGNTTKGDGDAGNGQDALPALPNDRQDNANVAPPPPPPVTAYTALSSASWNPALRPNSPADLEPATNTAAIDPVSSIPDLSADEFPDTRIPITSSSAPDTTLSPALPTNASPASPSDTAANTRNVSLGEQQQQQPRSITNPDDLANVADDENNTTDDDRPRMKSGEEALREATQIPVPAAPKDRPVAQHIYPSISAPTHKTFWEEVTDQSRTLLNKATLFTILSLLVHLAFYGLAVVLWQNWASGNVWKLANESTRKATQQLLFASRGGQGQSWLHWVISERWASGIDYMLYKGFGGELIAYRMPG